MWNSRIGVAGAVRSCTFQIAKRALSRLRKQSSQALAGAIFIAVALGQPSSVWAAVATDKFAGIHKIGVSSNLGDQAEILRIGATVFGNSQTFLPISDWNLDAVASDEIIQSLKGRYDVTSTPFTESDIAKIKVSFFSGISFKDAVLAQPPRNLDAYLILRATKGLVNPAGYLTISGLGTVRQWSGIGGPDREHHFGEDIVHFTYAAYLVNAKTGEMIAAGVGWAPKEKRTFADALLIVPSPMSSPHTYTGDASWPMTAGELTDVQKKVLHDDLVGLIKTSLPDTLKNMGLITADEQQNSPELAIPPNAITSNSTSP